MTAHIAGLPVEELVTWMLGGGAAGLAVRPWASLAVARIRDRGDAGRTD
jgi:hypothetical protein